jgi:hypothetical protein
MNPSCTSTAHLVQWLSNSHRGIYDREKIVSFVEFDEMLTNKIERKLVQRGILRGESRYSNESYKKNEGENDVLKLRRYWQWHANRFYERQANLALKKHEAFMKAKSLNKLWIVRHFGKNDSAFATVQVSFFLVKLQINDCFIFTN